MAASLERGWLGVLSVVAACSFSGPGGGQGVGSLGGLGEDTGTSAGGSAADDEGPTAGDGADDDGDDTAGLDDGGPKMDLGGDGTDDGPPVIGGAEVVFVAGSPIDLGAIDSGSNAPFAPLALRNDGDVDAQNLSGQEPVPPLEWAGGQFPGTNGTCGATLAPGQTCDVVLAPVPGAIGYSSQMIAIDYQDSGVSESASAVVGLAGIGTSADLVNNGGFQQGATGSGNPPQDWTVASGGWYITNNQGQAGGRSAFGGSAVEGTTTALTQIVALEPWTEAISTLGLGVTVRGFAHAQYNDYDEFQLVVTELDGAGVAQASHETPVSGADDWTELTHLDALDASTRSVRIELRCIMNNGSNCNVWFDSIEAHVTYPPP